MPDAVPYWRVISILFSSKPMSEDLALTLYRTALDLKREGHGSAVLDQDLVHGEIRDTKKSAVLGSIAGPVFEADLETAEGKMEVRFLVTREGLDALSRRAAKKPRKARRRQYLN